MGLGFVLKTAYLLPLTGLFLALALAALTWRAKSRRGYGPFTLGVVAVAAVLVGKFALSSETAAYAGAALLVGASMWNAWPVRSAGG